jgi:hypothetical protein
VDPTVDTGGEFIKPAFLQVVHSEKIKEFRHSGEFATSVNCWVYPSLGGMHEAGSASAICPTVGRPYLLPVINIITRAVSENVSEPRQVGVDVARYNVERIRPIRKLANRDVLLGFWAIHQQALG